jgi:hypothetical protein
MLRLLSCIGLLISQAIAVQSWAAPGERILPSRLMLKNQSEFLKKQNPLRPQAQIGFNPLLNPALSRSQLWLRTPSEALKQIILNQGKDGEPLL